MIVTVGGEKGGPGKTTLAVTLAAMHAARNSVLLVNADPQQSAEVWTEQRRHFHPDAVEIIGISLRGHKIHRDLRDLEKRYGTVVVDTGGRESPELLAAAGVSRVLVLPVRPDQFDLETLRKMAGIIDRVRAMNEGLVVKVVLNQVPAYERDKAQADANAWIRGNCPDIPEAQVVIGFRNAFRAANTEGLAVTEMARKDPKAVTEALRLYREAFHDAG